MEVAIADLRAVYLDHGQPAIGDIDEHLEFGVIECAGVVSLGR